MISSVSLDREQGKRSWYHSLSFHCASLRNIYVGIEAIERLNEIEVSTLGEGGIFTTKRKQTCACD